MLMQHGIRKLTCVEHDESLIGLQKPLIAHQPQTSDLVLQAWQLLGTEREVNVL